MPRHVLERLPWHFEVKMGFPIDRKGAAALFAEMSSVMDISESQNGLTVPIAVGSTFNVVLPENPTTGYTWKLDVPDNVQLVDDVFKANSDRVGSPGIHTWTFKANKVAMGEIKASHNRSWEDADPIKEFSVKINVH